MKNALYMIGFVLVMAAGLMADSETLVPSIVCGLVAVTMIGIANSLFKTE